MRIKKYIAASMPEAMKQIRADLGTDAVILNSKEISQGGFLGFFKKKKVEVIAALDPKPLHKEEASVQKKTDPLHHLPQIKENKLVEKTKNELVLNEIKQLKKMMENQSSQKTSDYLEPYQKGYDYLCDQEVDPILAKNIIDRVMIKHENLTDISENTLHQDIKDVIEAKLTETSFKGITYDQQVIQFVGPTGVGKTTTLAKVAAESILKHHKTVAFITSDTYRIAAIEQLKTYARILDVPIEVAYTAEDYYKAIDQFSSYDLILVDTAGRNFRDEQYIDALLDQSSHDTKTYLVLALTAKPKDITEIYSQFKQLNIQDIIFTKLDETTQYGSILNMAVNHNIGIAYMTNGQDVPEDLLKPSAALISDYLLSGFLDE